MPWLFLRRSQALQDPVSGDGAGGRRWGLAQLSALQPFYSTVINFCVTFCCLKFTQVKMKKRWRSVEASKGEAMLVLPCASPNYPQVFLAVPILEKGCDKTGEGERKTSMSLVRSRQARPGADGSHFSSYCKDQQVKKWGLKGYIFPSRVIFIEK